MVPALREKFNKNFSQKNYEEFLKDLNTHHPGTIDFRMAETPIFVDKAFKDKMLSACESIIDVIEKPDFISLTANVSLM